MRVCLVYHSGISCGLNDISQLLAQLPTPPTRGSAASACPGHQMLSCHALAAPRPRKAQRAPTPAPEGAASACRCWSVPVLGALAAPLRGFAFFVRLPAPPPWGQRAPASYPWGRSERPPRPPNAIVPRACCAPPPEGAASACRCWSVPVLGALAAPLRVFAIYSPGGLQ